jgi:hypothetical protein
MSQLPRALATNATVDMSQLYPQLQSRHCPRVETPPHKVPFHKVPPVPSPAEALRCIIA